jgi:lipopolysaccharide kinase (Kdo/WaaP) family protein
MSAVHGSIWQRLWHGVRRLHERPDWKTFAGADWAERIMDVALTEDFHAKQGRSTGRWVLHQGDRRLAVYLKRHERLSWWRGLLAALWPGRGWSPALAEWRHLQWARARGLPVPAPVAAGEWIGPWCRLRSFVAIEELTGMLPLHEALPAAERAMSADTFLQWKRTLIAQLARITRELHDCCVFHKDLYLCHFFVPGTNLATVPRTWRGRVHVIDLHRLGHHAWTRRFWQLKDLAQLLYSSHWTGVTPRDRLRFWRHYLGPARRTWRNRFFAWCIRLKAQRYLNHNAKKRARYGQGGMDNGHRS